MMMRKNDLRILIVDDDEDIRVNLGDILSDRGFAIETAADGELALQKFAKAQSADRSNAAGGSSEFDLCLLDFRMPGMNGAELFQKMRRQCPDIRAIMITAYAGDDGFQEAKDAGAWTVLHKPVDVDSLLKMIGQAAI